MKPISSNPALSAALRSAAPPPSPDEGSGKLREVAEKTLEVSHIGADVFRAFADGPGATVPLVGAGVLVAGLALPIGLSELRSADPARRLGGAGHVALGAASVLESAALLTGNPAVSNALAQAARPLVAIHGLVDVAEGVRDVREGLKTGKKSQVAVGVLQTGLGVGMLAGAVANLGGPATQAVGLGILGCFVGKQALLAAFPEKASG
jgi:hypothetical protein